MTAKQLSDLGKQEVLRLAAQGLDPVEILDHMPMAVFDSQRSLRAIEKFLKEQKKPRACQYRRGKL